MYIGTYPIFQTSSVSKPVCSVFKIRHWIMFLEIGEVNFAKRMPLLHPFFPPKIKLHTFSDNSQSTSVQCRNATERKTQCARASYNRSSVQAFEKSTIIKDYRKNNLPAFHFAFRQHFLLFGSNEGDKGESHRFLIHIHNMNSFQSFIS